MGQLIRRSMTSLAARGRPKVGARESGSGTFETCRRRPLAIAQRLQTGSPKTKLLPPQLPRGPKRSGAEPYLHHDGFVFNGERPDRQAHGEADAGEHRCTASYPNSRPTDPCPMAEEIPMSLPRTIAWNALSMPWDHYLRSPDCAPRRKHGHHRRPSKRRSTGLV